MRSYKSLFLPMTCGIAHKSDPLLVLPFHSDSGSALQDSSHHFEMSHPFLKKGHEFDTPALLSLQQKQTEPEREASIRHSSTPHRSSSRIFDTRYERI
ncbi:hypothetical protein MHYP_G00133010 [Metynnis hypsauchen]